MLELQVPSVDAAGAPLAASETAQGFAAEDARPADEILSY